MPEKQKQRWFALVSYINKGIAVKFVELLFLFIS
ncbi:hypothetical protein ERO13_A02G027802v2 [Gossypium hirsutum]|nr:hypothetical protein ERO13_A02G027802v2 [Gossypium hirsutum]